MAQSGSNGPRRSGLRALVDRLLMVTRILPGVGRARPEMFGVEDGPSDRKPMTDEAGRTLHDQDHPGAPRHERGHPKR